MNKISVVLIMGSQSDWQILAYTSETLNLLSIGYEAEVVSAHRTPDKLFHTAKQVEIRGVETNGNR